MSAIYYKGQKYTGPTLNLGSGSLTTDDKTIVGGINEINSSISILNTALEDKQNTLVSGTNIKTINNESILGDGNLTINVSLPSNNITGSGTSGYLTKFNGTNTITDGPALGSGTTTFLRNDGSWAAPSSNALSDISLTWSSSVSTTDWFLAHDTATTGKVLFRAMSPTNVRTTIGAAASSVVGTGTLNTTNKNCIAAINELNSGLSSCVKIVYTDSATDTASGFYGHTEKLYFERYSNGVERMYFYVEFDSSGSTPDPYGFHVKSGWFSGKPNCAYASSFLQYYNTSGSGTTTIGSVAVMADSATNVGLWVGYSTKPLNGWYASGCVMYIPSFA